MSDHNRQLTLSGFGDEKAASNESVGDATSLEGRTVYVIDSHSLIFQVFHAIGGMTSPHGEPVNAIFGFTRDLFYLLENKKPDFLICAFDRPGPTFRHELFEDYKADRGEMPEELSVQFPGIRQVIEILNVPLIEHEKYEADDVLATIARICDAAKANCMLVTGDKDCRQLITDHVSIYNIRKDSVYDKNALASDWGIRPDQVVDFQSLVGDSVDNIPGVARIGPKTATDLLKRFDNLEEIFKRIDEISGAKQQYLVNGQDDAIKSRELVRLVDDLPLQIDWEAAAAGDINTEAGIELFRKFGFRGLSDQLVKLGGQTKKTVTWDVDYQCIDTIEQLDKLVEKLAEQKQISMDVETTHVQSRWAELVGYSFCFTEGTAYYIPVRAPSGETCLDHQQTLEKLRPILENPDIEKVGQNLKYDLVVLRTAGIEVRGVGFDTMVASYLLEAGRRSHSLATLAKHYLNYDMAPIESLIGKGKNQKSMDEVPVKDVTHYAAEDADVPFRLRPLLESRMQEWNLSSLFQDLELPLIDVLVELEFNGIRVDTHRLAELGNELSERVDALEEEIYKLAGSEFNIASPKQLAKILFTDLGLPIIKKKKSNPSTDADVLEQLALEHPLPAKIIEYRQFSKLKNTYVDALPSLVHPKTSRVHASFNQVVAATGRLSSSDPNLQNIPIRTEVGRQIRSAFLPGQPDWKLLAADYSQVELRVLAHFSGDEALLEAFHRDEDIHALVASQVYNVSLEEVNSDMRRGAKAVNFGVVYGLTSFGLSKALNIEREAAAEFIEAYFARYPRVDEFIRETMDECREQGYVSTLFGRRREIRGIRHNTSGRQRTLAERMAINTVIQGTAADLIKQAMINIHRKMKQHNHQSRMLLQIHDELVFEVPPEEIEMISTLVVTEMENAAELKVPLKVDLKLGDNWAEV